MKTTLHNRAKTSGFSVLELVVVVAILGIISSIAIPAFSEVLRVSKVSRAASDLRVFSGAIETYSLERGGYPEDADHGQMPVGLQEYMSSKWLEETPLGGLWDWDQDVFGVTAAISIRLPADPDARTTYMWFQLDERVDDGNLAEGRIRIAPSRLMFILEENS